MRKFVYDHAVVIAISLSFFAFGYILGSDVFDLSSDNVLTVFIGGAVCGLTILLMEIARSGTPMRFVRFAMPARPAGPE
jgi:hypothetical protein